MDHEVSVVICNGNQEKAVKQILAGRKIGTFFTREAIPQTSPVEVLAENGNFCGLILKETRYFKFYQHSSSDFMVGCYKTVSKIPTSQQSQAN